MTGFLIFHVRIKYDNRKESLTFQLKDINQTVIEFLTDVVPILKEDNKTDLVKIIEDSIKKNKIACWKRSCDKNTKFINLLSKIEKINGKEVDTFELELE
jgi:hypothetical protein